MVGLAVGTEFLLIDIYIIRYAQVELHGCDAVGIIQQYGYDNLTLVETLVGHGDDVGGLSHGWCRRTGCHHADEAHQVESVCL